MTFAGIREQERTWRTAEADLLEAKADTIVVALAGLAALDGMFDDRRELRSAVTVVSELLAVEVENLRQSVRRALTEPGEVSRPITAQVGENGAPAVGACIPGSVSALVSAEAGA